MVLPVIRNTVELKLEKMILYENLFYIKCLLMNFLNAEKTEKKPPVFAVPRASSYFIIIRQK